MARTTRQMKWKKGFLALLSLSISISLYISFFLSLSLYVSLTQTHFAKRKLHKEKKVQ
jgi:hypothetical protein